MLLPKGDNPIKPGSQRPITCLNVAYKLFTGTVAHILLHHVKHYDLLPIEQKALKAGHRGCFDTVAIDSALAKEAKSDRRNLSMVWLDFQKAFDRVPHKWIKKALKIVSAPKEVKRAVRRVVPLWRTKLELRGPGGEVLKIPVRFKGGIYQGDTLSPLLFGMAIAPLSTALRRGGGFHSKHHEDPITHLVYMDDIKLYEEKAEEAEATLGHVEGVARAIGMQLGAPKCGVVHIKRGKVVRKGGISTRITEVTEVRDSYKYLGVDQLFGERGRQTAKRVSAEYLHRVHMRWRAGLNSRKTVRMHNSYAMGVLRYLCSMTGLTARERTALARKTRKIMIKAKAHHLNASVDPLYIPRKKGGRGLQNVLHTWEQSRVSAALYILKSTDTQLRGVVRAYKEADERGSHNPIAEARAILTQYQMASFGTDWLPPTTVVPLHRIMAELKAKQEKALEDRLRGKQIHGVYRRELESPGVDSKGSSRWLTDGLLMPQTEATIAAAQDGVIHTRAYKARVLRDSCPVECRMCGKGTETLGHILSSCEIHNFGAYKDRHDRVLFLLVKAVMQYLNLKPPKELTKPGGIVKPGVYGTKHREIRVDQVIPTMESIRARRPDLVVIQAREKVIHILDVACCWEPKLLEREKEKRAKYQNLKADMARQYQDKGYKVHVIPVVMGDLGIVKNTRRAIVASELLNQDETDYFLSSAQRETLVQSVKLIKRHMVV